MAALWNSQSVDDWEAIWAQYEDVVEALEKDKLVELDAWFRNELPTVLHGRDPNPFITQKELVKLMEWKLKKGKWRPQLMTFVTNLTDKQVKDASTKAFNELTNSHVKAAIEALAALKGIGPATASAVLAVYDEQVPFMGDEALEAIASIIGARKYTLAHFMSFYDELTKKATWLRSHVTQDKDKWTPQRVQLCLYAETNTKTSANTSQKKAAGTAKKEAAAPKRKAPVADDDKDKDKVQEKEADVAAATTGRRTRQRTSSNNTA